MFESSSYTSISLNLMIINLCWLKPTSLWLRLHKKPDTLIWISYFTYFIYLRLLFIFILNNNINNHEGKTGIITPGKDFWLTVLRISASSFDHSNKKGDNLLYWDHMLWVERKLLKIVKMNQEERQKTAACELIMLTIIILNNNNIVTK